MAHRGTEHSLLAMHKETKAFSYGNVYKRTEALFFWLSTRVLKNSLLATHNATEAFSVGYTQGNLSILLMAHRGTETFSFGYAQGN